MKQDWAKQEEPFQTLQPLTIQKDFDMEHKKDSWQAAD